MCFGPSPAEKKAAAEQRVEADVAQQEAIVQKAEKKKEDINVALEAKAPRQAARGMRAGRGRRSLFRAGGAGFLGRFL